MERNFIITHRKDSHKLYNYYIIKYIVNGVINEMHIPNKVTIIDAINEFIDYCIENNKNKVTKIALDSIISIEVIK